MEKFIGYILIMVGLSAGLLYLNPPLADWVVHRLPTSTSQKTPQSISQHIHALLMEDLKSSPDLKKWPQPAEVTIEFRGEKARKILSQKMEPFPTKEKSEHKIHIIALDLPDKEKPGIIFQMSLIHIPSGNTQGEFGKTFFYQICAKNPAIHCENAER